MTQALLLAPIGSVALRRVNRNIVVSGPEENKRKEKSAFSVALDARRRCEIGRGHRARRGAAAAGVGVYIENNRGGCFDARCSVAVSKTHRQCRK